MHPPAPAPVQPPCHAPASTRVGRWARWGAAAVLATLLAACGGGGGGAPAPDPVASAPAPNPALAYGNAGHQTVLQAVPAAGGGGGGGGGGSDGRGAETTPLTVPY